MITVIIIHIFYNILTEKMSNQTYSIYFICFWTCIDVHRKRQIMLI